MAIATGTAVGVQKPLATVVSGLITATMLTLLILPPRGSIIRATQFDIFEIQAQIDREDQRARGFAPLSRQCAARSSKVVRSASPARGKHSSPAHMSRPTLEFDPCQYPLGVSRQPEEYPLPIESRAVA